MKHRSLLLMLFIVVLYCSSAQAQWSINYRLAPSFLFTPQTTDALSYVNPKQFYLQHNLNTSFFIKERFLIGVGINYQSRNAENNCVRIPDTNEPYLVPLPIISSNDSICDLTMAGYHKIIDFPIAIGIILYNKKRYMIHTSLSISPIHRNIQRRNFTDKITNKKSMLSYSNTKIFEEMPIRLSFSLDYQWKNNWSFLIEPILSTDDKTFQKNAFGLGIGMSYKLKN